MTCCQPVPSTAFPAGARGGSPESQGTRRGIAGTPGSCSASLRHRGGRGHRHPLRHAEELGTYAAFSRCGNNTCSAPCSAPGGREGSPSTRCPSGRPHQPPAHLWGLASPFRPWAPMGGQSSGAPRGEQLLPSTTRAEREGGNFSALTGAGTPPAVGSRCRCPPSARAARWRGAGLGGSFMDIHEQRVG